MYLVLNDTYMILLIDNFSKKSELIYSYLTKNNHKVDFAFSLASAFELIHCNKYQALIINYEILNTGIIQLCQKMRKKNASIIFLCEKLDTECELSIYQAGDVEVLLEPYSHKKLLQKLASLNIKPLNCLSALEIDDGSCNVVFNNKALVLSKLQMSIFNALVQRHPNAVSRSEIIKQIKESLYIESYQLSPHIYNLSATLKKSFGTLFIKNIYGEGYKLLNLNL